MDCRLILLFSLFIVSVNGFLEEDDDSDNGFDFNYDDPDDASACGMDYHDYEGDESKLCHNAKFPSETLQAKFGSSVKTCCENHGYIFEQDCEVSN